MQGTIKKLVRERGFGFINAQDGREIFFHRSGLQQLDFETVKEGQEVEFEVERGDKGPRAINVRPSRAWSAVGLPKEIEQRMPCDTIQLARVVIPLRAMQNRRSVP